MVRLSLTFTTAVSVLSVSASPTGALNGTAPRPASPGSLVGFDPKLIGSFAKDAIKTEFRTSNPSQMRLKLVVDPPIVKPFNPNNKIGIAPEKRFIVGVDDRSLNTDTAYPYSAIGKIQWSNGVWCSGTLVGPRHVVTARHCLPNASGISGTFSPGYNNGATFGSSQINIAVSIGTQSDACDTKSDWAVLVLNDRLGDQRGWYGVKYPDNSVFNQPIGKHQGYPSDKDSGSSPYLQINTTPNSAMSLNCDATGPFYSDTDCETGQSGGPFWEDQSDGPYVWGVLSITVTSPQTTYAGWASGSDMLNSINNLRNEYP